MTASWGIGYVAMATGMAAVLLVAGSIVLTDLIISQGDYSSYPTIDWIKGVGLSILEFIGLMGISGAMLPLITLGSISIYLIADSIRRVDGILSESNFAIYPTTDWMEGVGLAILKFGGLLIASSALIAFIALGSLSMSIIANTILKISEILSQGYYSSYPSLDWIRSVDKSIDEFTSLMIRTALVPNKVLDWGKESLLKIADTIIEVSKKVSSGIYSGGPNMEWIS